MNLTNERLEEICSRPLDPYGRQGETLEPSRVADDAEIDLAFVELLAARKELEALRNAIAIHRKNVWGDGGVANDEDVRLYATINPPQEDASAR